MPRGMKKLPTKLAQVPDNQGCAFCGHAIPQANFAWVTVEGWAFHAGCPRRFKAFVPN